MLPSGGIELSEEHLRAVAAFVFALSRAQISKEEEEAQNKGSTESGSFERGRSAYEAGLRHFRKSMPGMPEVQAQLQAAKENFELARKHLERAEEEDPGNAKVAELLDDIGDYMFDIRRRLKPN